MTHPLLQLLEALSSTQTKSAHPSSARQAETHGPNRSGSDPNPFDQSRLIAKLFEESQRINMALFRMIVEPQLRAQTALLRHTFGAPAPNGNGHSGANPDDDLFEMLSKLQLWVLQNPMAAQAVFAALVAEGRKFATTAAGGRWARAMAESDLVRKGRLIWEATTLNLLEEREGSILPSAYLELLRKVVTMKDFETLLSRLRQGIAEDPK